MLNWKELLLKNTWVQEGALVLLESQVEALLLQQAAETRLATIDECTETFRKETEGVCHAACNKPLYLGTVYEKLKSLKEQTN